MFRAVGGSKAEYRISIVGGVWRGCGEGAAGRRFVDMWCGCVGKYLVVAKD